MNDGLALDIAMELFITAACDGYVGIGRTDSCAGLQMFPLQLAYRHGDGADWELLSLLLVGVFGFGFGFGSPLLCCLTFALLFLNHTCTLDSGKLIFIATSSLIKMSGYFVLEKSSSSISSWALVKVVRSLLCFRG